MKENDPNEKKLNHNQQTFVDAYMAKQDNIAAYLKVFPEHKDNPNLYRSAYSYLNGTTVRNEVNRRMCYEMVNQEISAERVLQEIAGIAFVPLSDSQKIGQSKNKLRALEDLGKNMRLFVDRVEVANVLSFEEQLLKIKQEAKEAPSREFIPESE